MEKPTYSVGDSGFLVANRTLVLASNSPQSPTTQDTSKISNMALGRALALSQGYTERDWNCFNALVMAESGWSETAINKTSGAFGLPQALPASKMDSFGDRTKPETQLKWMFDYIARKYQTPCNAYQLQVSRNPHWY